MGCRSACSRRSTPRRAPSNAEATVLGCSCRRSCLFLASLLVLLAARVSRVSAEHSALLFTLGNPTAAQRARVCRLVAEERAAASTAAVLDVHVLDYHPASSGSTLLDGMCGPGAPQPDTVSALTRAGLAAVFGPEFGDFYMRHAYRLPQTHYSWWWTAVGAARGYERVWVLEADGAPRGQGVGWAGNLFDGLAAFALWPADMLCTQPRLVAVGDKAWGLFPNGDHMTLWHSGWMNASEDGSSSAPAAALHTCYVYAARYSARLLAALAAHHAAGRWGYSELEATELCARGAAVPRCLVARLDVPLSAPAGGVSFGPPWAHGNSGLVTEAELGARRARAQLGATVVFHKVVQ